MPLDPQVQELRATRARLGYRQLYTYAVRDARAADLASVLAMGDAPEPVAAVEDRSIPGPGGPLPLRVYRPAADARLPVLVYFFGGGWMLGTIETSDAICRNLANARWSPWDTGWHPSTLSRQPSTTASRQSAGSTHTARKSAPTRPDWRSAATAPGATWQPP